jgi:hypothetical protein
VKPSTLRVPQPGQVEAGAALVVVGVTVVRTHPGIGLQAGSTEPKGRTQTWQLVVTVWAGGVVLVLVPYVVVCVAISELKVPGPPP